MGRKTAASFEDSETRRSLSVSSTLSSSTTLVTARGSPSPNSSSDYERSALYQPDHKVASALSHPEGHLPDREKSYATSVNYTEEEEGDLGGGLSPSSSESDTRKRAKGKGRMDEPATIAEEDEDEDDMDDEEQERRINENLSSWSKAEKQRRKSQRATSALVLPPTPLPSLPSAPGAALSSLSRRGSALIRNGTTKQARRLSNRITSTGAAYEEAEMTLVGEQNGEGTPKWREVSSILPDEAGTADVTGPKPPIENPFNSPPASPPIADDLPRRVTSRFIEDLPSQGYPREAFISNGPSNNTGARIGNGLHDPATDGWKAKEGQDVVVEQLLHSTKSLSRLQDKSEGIDDNPFLDPRPTIRLLPTSSAVESAPFLHDRQSSVPKGTGEGLDSAFSLVVPSNTLAYSANHRKPVDDYNDEEEDDMNDERHPGLLDWLFCGCFGAEKGEETQRGATNPME